MRPELLEALSQAEQSEPSVKAAALMRIARVLTKTDQAEAERLLDRGLALLAELPEKVKSAITPQATCLAACVAPNRAFALHAATGDDSGSGKFLIDHRGRVTFSSQRPCMLFELLGPLRQLDPELADVMISENPELARAAAVYPLGHDTPCDRPVEPPSAEEQEQWLREWTGFALGMRFFRIDEEQRSDFTDSFALAHRAFERDANAKRPNLEPRECWPSAEDFLTILYAVGKYDPASGPRLLDRIPDPALRLFALIEFAAGVAGLEQIGGMTRESRASRWPWAAASA